MRSNALLTVTLFVALCSTTERVIAQTVTLIDPGIDNRILSISGLSIGGTSYDATFHHGMSYNSVPDPKDTFAGTSAFDFSQTTAAIEAVASAVGSLPNAPSPTVTAVIPNREFFGNRVTVSWINPQANYSTWDPSDARLGVTFQNTVLPSNYAWLTFEETAAAVPEPSSLLMAGCLFLSAMMFTRRRRDIGTSSLRGIAPVNR